MNKWAVRILGILMIVAFLLLMASLEKQLLMLQRTRQPKPAPATTTT